MNFHDNQPITYWGRVPVYVSTLLAAAIAVGVVIVAFVGAANSAALSWMGLTVPLMAPWSLWQFVTYPFLEGPSFFSLFGITVCSDLFALTFSLCRLEARTDGPFAAPGTFTSSVMSVEPI